MKISSPDFQNNTEVPKEYTCLGPNVNPPLHFDTIPAGAKSLVLIIEDRNATPKPWIHWLVFNIPPTTTELKKNSIPEGGTPGICNGGTFGYEGPCPIYFKGTHHYYFRLFALDEKLLIPDNSDAVVVHERMKGHILEEATLVGLCTSNS